MARNVKYSVITKCINEWTKVRLKTMATLSIILMTLVILSMAWTTFFYDRTRVIYTYVLRGQWKNDTKIERRIKQKNMSRV